MAFGREESQQVNILPETQMEEVETEVGGLRVPSLSAPINVPLSREVTLTCHKPVVTTLSWPQLTPSIGSGYFLEDVTHCTILES